MSSLFKPLFVACLLHIVDQNLLFREFSSEVGSEVLVTHNKPYVTVQFYGPTLFPTKSLNFYKRSSEILNSIYVVNSSTHKLRLWFLTVISLCLQKMRKLS